jgi:hypothetical protein
MRIGPGASLLDPTIANDPAGHSRSADVDSATHRSTYRWQVA